jgi:hypothetical protein
MTVDVPPVGDIEHKHDALLVVDPIDDPVGASPSAVATFEPTKRGHLSKRGKTVNNASTNAG